MSDFLSNLVERSLGLAAAVRPRQSLFEPDLAKAEGPLSFASFSSAQAEIAPTEPMVRSPHSPSKSGRSGLPRRGAEAGGVIVVDQRHAGSNTNQSDKTLPPGTQNNGAKARDEIEQFASEPGNDARSDAGDPREEVAATHAGLAFPAAPVVLRDRGQLREDEPIEARSSKPHETGGANVIKLISGHPGERRRSEPRREEIQRMAAARTAFPRRFVPRQAERPGPAEPTINVTIGRVEIRASLPPVAPKPARSMPAVTSLNEYLRRKTQGANG